jgi:hypothetical protein
MLQVLAVHTSVVGRNVDAEEFLNLLQGRIHLKDNSELTSDDIP